MTTDELFGEGALEEAVEQGRVRARRHPELPLTIYKYAREVQYSRTWDDITLSCRGLVADDDGKIQCRPYQKMFNVGEPDCPPLPANQRVEVWEKMDGSMISAFKYEGELLFASTGSFTSRQAQWAGEVFYEHYERAAKSITDDQTWLFELIHPNNRIVVDYGDRRDLVLHGIRENASGRHLNPPQSDVFPMPELVDYAMHARAVDFEKLQARNLENKEGYVLVFPDQGLRAKVKFDDYKRLHATLSETTTLSVWCYLSGGKSFEDLLARTPDEFDDWVRGVAEDIESSFLRVKREHHQAVARLKVGEPTESAEDRKKTAQAFQASEYDAGTLFQCLLNPEGADDIFWKMARPEYEKATLA